MDSLRFQRYRSNALCICIVLASLLAVSAANSVQTERNKSFDYDKTFTLQCNITANPDTQIVFRWSKDGTTIVPTPEKYKIVDEENKLLIYKPGDDDVGTYTCQAVNVKTNQTEPNMKAEIKVLGLPKITLPEDTPVVEGERLKLHCQVKGYPKPNVTWSIGDMVLNRTDPRIQFRTDEQNGLEGAILIIENVQMSDRNHYTCYAQNAAVQGEQPKKTTFVRVKDKLAALWPFLGICAEVAILCTIILIYEKKRNKTELDESDTDQSPEQKNTPDHGKDVRQRK